MSQIDLNPNQAEVKKSSTYSLIFRLMLMGFWLLLFLIPSSLIWYLNQDRQSYQREVASQISKSWGEGQRIHGPVLFVPYLDKKGDFRELSLMPEESNIEAILEAKPLKKSIYEVPVYQTTINEELRFQIPSLSNYASAQNIYWDQARILMQISSPKGLKEIPKLQIQGAEYTMSKQVEESKIFFELKLNQIGAAHQISEKLASLPLKLKLKLSGSEELKWMASARQSNVHLTGNWSHPNFSGFYLPDERVVKKDFFDAKWKIIRSDFPSADLPYSFENENEIFGLNLANPVDVYTQLNRSLKYSSLFIVLTFSLLFGLEIFKKLRIHPIQYLLVGLSLCIFYLLLLSLSEYIGFLASYLLSSLAVVFLIVFYLQSTLGSKLYSGLVTGMLLSLYTYLYVLLNAQSYVLLMGSLGLFFILALAMVLTRKINWYQMDGEAL